MESVITIDTRQYFFPIPLLLIKKEMAKLAIGQVLRVNGIEKNSLKDIANWCERTKNSFIDEEEKDGFLSVFITKG